MDMLALALAKDRTWSRGGVLVAARLGIASTCEAFCSRASVRSDARLWRRQDSTRDESEQTATGLPSCSLGAEDELRLPWGRTRATPREWLLARWTHVIFLGAVWVDLWLLSHVHGPSSRPRFDRSVRRRPPRTKARRRRGGQGGPKAVHRCTDGGGHDHPSRRHRRCGSTLCARARAPVHVDPHDF